MADTDVFCTSWIESNDAELNFREKYDVLATVQWNTMKYPNQLILSVLNISGLSTWSGYILKEGSFNSDYIGIYKVKAIQLKFDIWSYWKTGTCALRAFQMLFYMKSFKGAAVLTS